MINELNTVDKVSTKPDEKMDELGEIDLQLHRREKLFWPKWQSSDTCSAFFFDGGKVDVGIVLHFFRACILSIHLGVKREEFHHGTVALSGRGIGIGKTGTGNSFMGDKLVSVLASCKHGTQGMVFTNSCFRIVLFSLYLWTQSSLECRHEPLTKPQQRNCASACRRTACRS